MFVYQLCAQVPSRVRLFVTPWAPLPVGFSQQEYWSRLPFPPPGDLPHSGIELGSSVFLVLQADSLPLSQEANPIN